MGYVFWCEMNLFKVHCIGVYTNSSNSNVDDAAPHPVVHSRGNWASRIRLWNTIDYRLWIYLGPMIGKQLIMKKTIDYEAQRRFTPSSFYLYSSNKFDRVQKKDAFWRSARMFVSVLSL